MELVWRKKTPHVEEGVAKKLISLHYMHAAGYIPQHKAWIYKCNIAGICQQI